MPIMCGDTPMLRILTAADLGQSHVNRLVRNARERC
jgi:hypothetical protein